LTLDDPFALAGSTPASAGGGGGAPADTENLLDTAQQYLEGVKRRWKLVVLIVLLAVIAGIVHFTITPPTYQADCIIQIERRSTNSLITSQLPWLDQYFNFEFYPTQYRLLESRGLAENVVRDLRLSEDPRYARGGGGSGGSDGEDRATVGRIANRLRGGLSVQPIRDTQLVRLTYRSNDAGEAARIANAFAQSFIDFGIRTRSETMTEASGVLADQIDRLKGEVMGLEERLTEFSGDETTFTFTPEGEVAFQRVESLTDDLMDARRSRIERQARYQELQALPDEAVAANSALVAQMRSEQARLEREYETKSQIYKSGWPEMTDLAASIEAGRQTLAATTSDEARKVRQTAYADYQGALREEGALEGEIRKLRAQMSSENGQAVDFNNAKVELAANRELLDDLVRRQSETAFATQLQTDASSNVRIVDEALVPGGATNPSLRKDVGAGIFAGLLLGLGAALLLQFLDRTIKSAEELERLMGLPVLAVIPDVSDSGRGGDAYAYEYAAAPADGGRKKGQRRWGDRRAGGDKVSIELLPHTRPRLAVSEAYRSLRTALLLSTAEELKVVSVTSVESAEGKTATATNLAVVLAQLGRKVALIDGDLRKPRLHKVFKASNRIGLVTYLTTGSEEGIFTKTEVPGLYLVASGPTPPNPSELLASDRMSEMVARLRQSFDYVVIDTPPTLPVTDSTLIGAHSDGVVLCVRSAKVDRRDASRCHDRLRRAEIKVLGVVLNAHRATGGKGGAYRYYRAYMEDPEGEGQAAQAG